MANDEHRGCPDTEAGMVSDPKPGLDPEPTPRDPELPPPEDLLTPEESSIREAMRQAAAITGSGSGTELIGTSAAVAVGGLFESGTLALSQAMFGSVGNMQQAAILSQASTAANIRKMLAADTSNSTNDTLKLIEFVMMLMNRQSNNDKVVVKAD